MRICPEDIQDRGEDKNVLYVWGRVYKEIDRKMQGKTFFCRNIVRVCQSNWRYLMEYLKTRNENYYSVITVPGADNIKILISDKDKKPLLELKVSRTALAIMGKNEEVEAIDWAVEKGLILISANDIENKAEVFVSSNHVNGNGVLEASFEQIKVQNESK